MFKNCVAALMLATVAWTAQAQESFFSALVPVSDRTETALVTAAESAMTKVLTRVTGNEQFATNPRLAAAVADARNRLSLYSYQIDGDQMAVYIQFDPTVIEDILRSAEATFWGPDRPPVLLWMVVDEPYARRFATMAQDKALLKNLAEDFEARGVRLRLPLLDLEDAAALSLNMVWQKAVPQIQAASERYGTDHILVGRVVQLSSGRNIIDWLYINGDIQGGFQREGDDPAPILASAVDMVVDEMAAQYAVRLEKVSESNVVRLVIKGVESRSDYKTILEELGAVELLQGVQVRGVEGDVLRLQATGVNSAESLARVLPRRSRLVVAAIPEVDLIELRWGQP